MQLVWLILSAPQAVANSWANVAAAAAAAAACLTLRLWPMRVLEPRLIIGFTLSNFVACQFWCSSMFNVKVVGFANACGAGLVRRAFVFSLAAVVNCFRLPVPDISVRDQSGISWPGATGCLPLQNTVPGSSYVYQTHLCAVNRMSACGIYGWRQKLDHLSKQGPLNLSLCVNIIARNRQRMLQLMATAHMGGVTGLYQCHRTALLLLLLLLLLQGNMGSGWALLLMPLVCSAIVSSSGLPLFVAWRWCFMVPGCLQVRNSLQLVLVCYLTCYRLSNMTLHYIAL
jgi:hypothetical protein